MSIGTSGAAVGAAWEGETNIDRLDIGRSESDMIEYRLVEVEGGFCFRFGQVEGPHVKNERFNRAADVPQQLQEVDETSSTESNEAWGVLASETP